MIVQVIALEVVKTLVLVHVKGTAKEIAQEVAREVQIIVLLVVYLDVMVDVQAVARDLVIGHVVLLVQVVLITK